MNGSDHFDLTTICCFCSTDETPMHSRVQMLLGSVGILNWGDDMRPFGNVNSVLVPSPRYLTDGGLVRMNRENEKRTFWIKSRGWEIVQIHLNGCFKELMFL